MADSFGLKIGIEGEKEFKKALSEINQSFKVLGSEMKLVDSQFDKNDKSAEALTARNQVLNKEIEQQKQKIEMLRLALANAAESFGENDRRTQNWQIQLNNAQAALNGMERELRDNNNAINAAGDEYENAGEQADKFGDEVEGAAKETQNASGKLQKVGSVLKGVAVTIGAAAATAGAALVGITKSFLDLAESTREYREDQAKLDAAFITAGFTAEQAGEAYTGFYSILGEEDRSVEAVNHLAKLCSSEKELAQWTDIAAGVWATFGDSLPIEGLTEASNETAKTGKLTGVLADALNWAGVNEDEFQASLDGCNSEQERAVLITETLNGLYDDAAAKYKELNKDVIDSQKAQAKLTDAYAQLGAIAEPVMTTLKTMAADFLTALAPSISLIGDGLRGLLEGTTGAANTFAKGVSELIRSVTDKLTDIIPTLSNALTASVPIILEAGADIISALINGIVTALPDLANSALEIILELINGITQALPKLIKAAVQIIATLAKGLADAFPKLIPALVQMIADICNTLIENLPLLLDAALQLVMGLAQGIINAIPVLIEALPALINGIIAFLLESIPLIIQAGIQLLTSLVTALPDIITAIVEAIPLIIEGIITAVLEAIPQIIQAGIDLLIALIAALPQIINTIVKAIPKIISGITSALIGNIDKIIIAGVELLVSLVANLPVIISEIVKAVPLIIAGIVEAIIGSVGELANAGGELIKGLWEGISNAGSWLWDNVSGFFGGLVDDIKDFFGIHSPSRLFANLGGYMAEGLGEGFTDEMKAISKDMNNAIPTDFNFDVKSSVSGVYDGSAVKAVDVTIPLSVDGVTLTNIVSRIQWNQNTVSVRNMGVVT